MKEKKHKLVKIDQGNKRSFYLITNQDETKEYGFIDKYKNTRTEQFPWRACIYKDYSIGVHYDQELLGHYWNYSRFDAAEEVMKHVKVEITGWVENYWSYYAQK